MGKLSQVRSGLILWDGQGIFDYQSGALQNAASVVKGNVFVAPCDLEIIEAGVRILTTFTHASSALNLGTRADTESDTHATLNIQNKTGLVDYFAGATWTSKYLDRGQAYCFALAAADTTGLAAAWALCKPRGQ